MNLIKRCWQYTWRGPVNERTNTTGQGCSNEANQKHVPCFEPIVWTNGTNKHNQPNLDDLKEKCENGDTLDNKVSRHLFELQKRFQTIYFFYFAKHMKTIGYVMHFHTTAIAAVCMFCSHFFFVINCRKSFYYGNIQWRFLFFWCALYFGTTFKQ